MSSPRLACLSTAAAAHGTNKKKLFPSSSSSSPLFLTHPPLSLCYTPLLLRLLWLTYKIGMGRWWWLHSCPGSLTCWSGALRRRRDLPSKGCQNGVTVSEASRVPGDITQLWGADDVSKVHQWDHRRWGGGQWEWRHQWQWRELVTSRSCVTLWRIRLG